MENLHSLFEFARIRHTEDLAAAAEAARLRDAQRAALAWATPAALRSRLPARRDGRALLGRRNGRVTTATGECLSSAA
jgi:hypothetical protein